ncbi:hypothetical protein HBH56_152190 [Parastagonospora nodorum]|uniref:Peptidase S33 tripeptidyl aminopeptidase-like C-terminal domain-containing protein n=2 Tax=Phaeosphaeria nodorum (strain SN15 / ATCC MYA-4574 / FGSC 10173) TaxID=321614 RepID=A0A7U2F3Y5_PHANO|nr:hypothetical protein SNOG_05746 [Parastagonospora nodorum SN15]KAH3909779.1 hypothetical protein HBH56_152190 [Parastagonospora nodorum]EAT86810.1 hypothetical protein SNOG_05746 [Parastagonospora nodorum SN15]KAH3926658.1 hypothetical protein HBH54_165490 [Parastagonospora nodorum]KAH4134732.1 hypothetical protein HBH45_160440 [Parastagonospora nodorum]KAH4154902.1 hypothetical protein HBH44_139820 [Parastagonospora nodorum]
MLLTATTVLLVSVAAAFPAPLITPYSQLRSLETNNTVSSFKDIPKSSKLQWLPCYKRFECANLEVPLDYEQPSLGPTVVPWIRLKATNSSDIDVIYNPGGPAGSGIAAFLAGSGDRIMEYTGSKYNVVSFDPRGVNASDVDLTCFPGEADTREEFENNKASLSTPQEEYAQAVAIGKWCTAANKNTTARYAGTVAIVQDMLHFTKLQAALNGKEPEQALVWYYGLSYGTVIGHTLANLYPSRVGRIILDGNVHSEDYYKGIVYDSVSTFDNSMRYFFRVCAEAGSKKCAFATDSTDADGLEKRFDALLSDLEREPLQSIDPKQPVPFIITRDRVVERVFSWTYNPSRDFKHIAAVLAGLVEKNATIWNEAGRNTSRDAKPEPEPFDYTAAAFREAQRLITAIDAADRYPVKNVDNYLAVVERISKTGKWLGKDYAVGNPLFAAGMSILPPKSQTFPGFNKTKTLNPVLFVNPDADPATPLSSAQYMSNFFEGSAVVQQRSGGHTVSGVESSCTLKHMAAYLETGKVPNNGTVCETDKRPLMDVQSKRGLAAPVPLF